MSDYRLLAVGSLPPPLGGTSVSFQVFCDEALSAVDLDVINAAPRAVKENSRLLRLSNLAQLVRVLSRFLVKAPRRDVILVVGSHQFLFTVGSAITVVARLMGKRVFLRSFGYLDQYYRDLPSLLQRVFRMTLGTATGILVETQLATRGLSDVLPGKVHWVPGYRPAGGRSSSGRPRQCEAGPGLRLVFLSQVREEKGIFVLLDAMRDARIASEPSIRCDVYGPVFPSIEKRFATEVEQSRNVAYCGVIEPDAAVTVLAGYDALAFPSFWLGEGHPGVIMEAMMAGIPVIGTHHRSIPELIENGRNGLLTEPGSSNDLADAIWRIHAEPGLLEVLSQHSWERRTDHLAERIVAGMIELMRPPSRH